MFALLSQLESTTAKRLGVGVGVGGGGLSAGPGASRDRSEFLKPLSGALGGIFSAVCLLENSNWGQQIFETTPPRDEKGMALRRLAFARPGGWAGLASGGLSLYVGSAFCAPPGNMGLLQKQGVEGALGSFSHFCDAGVSPHRICFMPTPAPTDSKI